MRCDINNCGERIRAKDEYSSEFDIIFNKDNTGELTLNLCKKHYEEIKQILNALENDKPKC